VKFFGKIFEGGSGAAVVGEVVKETLPPGDEGESIGTVNVSVRCDSIQFLISKGVPFDLGVPLVQDVQELRDDCFGGEEGTRYLDRRVEGNNFISSHWRKMLIRVKREGEIKTILRIRNTLECGTSKIQAIRVNLT
jgi:hypothetical protein